MSPPTSSMPALRVTVAEAPRRIGKALYWCQADAADGIWRDECATGAWRKPKDIGLPEEDVSLSKLYDYYRVDGEDSLSWRETIRRDLTGSENRALIMGDLSEAVSLAENRNSWKSILSLPRKENLFVDAPRAFLTIDCDKLDLRLYDKEIDVIEQDGELPDMLSDIFDRMGLDWLISDMLVHLSSSHGLLDRHTLKAHLEWHLDEPLTLLQQKSVAAYINRRATDAGFGEIADLSIYAPNHFVFTAPPLLRRRIWRDGRGISTEVAHGPFLRRVRVVRRGQERTDVPGEALVQARTQTFLQHVAKVRRTIPPGDNDLKPGNVYKSIRSKVYAKALKTPSSKADAVLAQLQADFTAQIEALPGSDAETLQRRLRFVSPVELRRSWDAAIAKRRTWAPADASSVPPMHSVPAARAIVQRAVEDFIREAKLRNEGRQAINLSEEQLVTPEPPRPLHLLLRAPPGVGKTHAALNAVQIAHMMTERISYLSPTVRLSAEAVARKAATMPMDAYTQSRARHHKGRKHLCKNPEYDKLASRLEEIGRSPIKDVCGRCPLRDACAWPVQQSDHDSGLVAGQHAHATTSMQRIGEQSDAMPSFGIVDESLIGTMLEETQRPRSLSALQRAAARTVIRNDDGSPSNTRTNDLRAYRAYVLDALSKATPKLPRADMLHFAGVVTVRTKDGGQLSRTRLEDARASEKQARRTYDLALRQALEAIHERRAAGKPSVAAERRMSSALGQIKLSQWFDDLYRAVGATLKTQRKHVFGVFVHRDRVTLHIRAQLPAPFTARSWVWLDGTANTDVWGASLADSRAELRVLDVNVQPGHYHLTQYPDRAYGKGMFTQAQGDSSRANIQRLRRYVHFLAARHRGKDPQTDVLVICQKPVETLLRSLGLPSNVATEHFNNLRGLDRYKNTPCAVIVGRPLPTTTAIETATEALYYDNPQVEAIERAPRWLKGRRVLSLAAGGAVAVNTELHPDPRAESLRQQTADAEVRQAVLRLRVYDRTQDNPAELHVFGQADTGLPIHEVADWVDAERENAEIIRETGIICVTPEIMRCQSSSLLAGFSRQTCERVVSSITNFPHHPIRDIYGASPLRDVLQSVMREISVVDVNTNTDEPDFGAEGGSLSGWRCWSVGFAERGGKYASRVWVHEGRHKDPRTAVERETGLHVLTMKPVVKATKPLLGDGHRRPPGLKRGGGRHGGSGRAGNGAVAPAGGAGVMRRLARSG